MFYKSTRRFLGLALVVLGVSVVANTPGGFTGVYHKVADTVFSAASSVTDGILSGLDNAAASMQRAADATRSGATPDPTAIAKDLVANDVVTKVTEKASAVAASVPDTLREEARKAPATAVAAIDELTDGTDDTSPTSTMFDVAMATAVLTEPDEGPAGRTFRWPSGTVEVFVDEGSFVDAATSERVTAALAWLSTNSGVNFVVSSDPSAPFVVHGSNSVGGVVSVSATTSGVIVSAVADVGIGKERVVYEEVLQAAGPLGDHADDRSVFADSKVAQAPGAFDAWVVSTLYALPAGSDAASVSAALQSSLP